MTPAEALQARCQHLYTHGNENGVGAGKPLTMCTDTKSYPGKVLLAIRTQVSQVVLSIDSADWAANWQKADMLMGGEQYKPKPAVERAKEQAKEAAQQKPGRKKA